MTRARAREREIERPRTSSAENDALGTWEMRGNEVLKFIDFKMSSRREMRGSERKGGRARKGALSG